MVLALSVRTSWARRIARYTQMVLVGKYALGTISMILICAVIAIPLISQTKDGARISFVSTNKTEDDMPVMEKPKLQGVDGQNQPFTVTADSAVQESADKVRLFKVQGDLFRADNSWLNMVADDGYYDNKTKILVLRGNVSLYQDNGYSFVSPSVEIDTGKATARSKDSINGQGPLGNLIATGYEIRDNGQHMFFGGAGRVNVHLNR